VAGENAGLKCLQSGGISKGEIKKFQESTACVGWEIKRNVGVGDSGMHNRAFLLFERGGDRPAPHTETTKIFLTKKISDV